MRAGRRLSMTHDRPFGSDAQRPSARLLFERGRRGSLSSAARRPPHRPWRSRVPIARPGGGSPTARSSAAPHRRAARESYLRGGSAASHRTSRGRGLPIDSGWSPGPHRRAGRPAPDDARRPLPISGAAPGPYLRDGLPASLSARPVRVPHVHAQRHPGASFPSAATTVASCRPRLRPRVYRRRHPSAFVPNSATTAFSVVTANRRPRMAS